MCNFQLAALAAPVTRSVKAAQLCHAMHDLSQITQSATQRLRTTRALRVQVELGLSLFQQLWNVVTRFLPMVPDDSLQDCLQKLLGRPDGLRRILGNSVADARRMSV